MLGNLQNRLAIQYYGRGISYGELDEQSDRLATALVDFGLKKGDRVSLFLENCPQFVIAYYAVLKAGGIVVAANPMFKEDELRHEILDSGAKIIFTLDHLYPKVKAVRKGTRCHPRGRDELLGLPARLNPCCPFTHHEG